MKKVIFNLNMRLINFSKNLYYLFFEFYLGERKKDDAKHPCFNILPVETSPPHINMVRENITFLQDIDLNNARSKCIKKGLRSLLALYKLQSTIIL